MQIRANNIWLEYDTFGDREAKPLLLISGLNTPMTRWTGDFCAQLASRGYFVIRYDNRDCGLSEHFDAYQLCSGTRLLLSRLLGMKTSVPYTLIDMVQDGVALLDALGIQQAHVVGRSMGGHDCATHGVILPCLRGAMSRLKRQKPFGKEESQPPKRLAFIFGGPPESRTRHQRIMSPLL